MDAIKVKIGSLIVISIYSLLPFLEEISFLITKKGNRFVVFVYLIFFERRYRKEN